MEIRDCEWDTCTQSLFAMFKGWPTEVRLFMPHMITLRNAEVFSLILMPGMSLSGDVMKIPTSFIKLIDQVCLEWENPQEAFTIMWDEVLMMGDEINKKLDSMGVPEEYWIP